MIDIWYLSILYSLKNSLWCLNFLTDDDVLGQIYFFYFASNNP